MYATLLFMAPSGEVPFGGRSSQFYFQEGIISALCELAASRYKTSNPKLAGAYKRQAHLSCAATFRGLLRNDGKLYHIKNYFPVNTLHGCDHYGLYSVYSLFAGSVFSLAALNADETIKEYPTISEIGGYSLGLPNNFYKLYCNNNGNYLEFELKNNIIEDACGLGRILMADLPWGLLPVLPFSKEPNYKLDPSLPKNTCFTSIAPEWTNKEGKVYSLAQQEEQIGQYSIVAPNIWKVTYNVWDATVEYIADLNIKNQITLEISVSGNAVNQIMVIPVLEFDGLNKVETTLSNNGFTSLMNGKKLEVTSNSNQATFAGTAVNRTGLYKRVILPMKDGKIKIVFSVK